VPGPESARKLGVAASVDAEDRVVVGVANVVACQQAGNACAALRRGHAVVTGDARDRVVAPFFATFAGRPLPRTVSFHEQDALARVVTRTTGLGGVEPWALIGACRSRSNGPGRRVLRRNRGLLHGLAGRARRAPSVDGWRVFLTTRNEERRDHRCDEGLVVRPRGTSTAAGAFTHRQSQPSFNPTSRG
jgi:hypothetical protein